MNKKQSLLWQIQSDQHPAPSFVFGTMHVKNDRFFQHLNPVYAAIEQVEVYAAEYDFSEQENFHLPPDLMNIPEGKTLRDLLGDKKYEKLHAILLKAFGIELSNFPHLLPFFLLNVIGQQVLLQNSSISLDEHLWQYALQEGKKCTGVEKFSEQLKILQELDVQLQLKMLLDIGKNVRKYRRQLLKMADVYETGNPQALYQFTKKNMGKLRQKMLYQRNRIMADRIADYAHNTSFFASIGAAHLAGEKGVLRYLKQKGFQLQPISMYNRK
ncbi:MAG: TraB/GumN family protein [Bacteroidota bacterium]